MRQEILDWLKEVEGGYANDPEDHGGETNMGITHFTLEKAYIEGIVSYTNVNLLTYEDAKKIYEIMYYKRAACDKILAPLDWVHFDTAVNSGPGQAGRLLQYTINDLGIEKIEVDGGVGNNTLRTLKDVINQVGTRSVINTYLMYRMIFYGQIIRHDKTQIKFINNWLNRITKLKKRTL